MKPSVPRFPMFFEPRHAALAEDVHRHVHQDRLKVLHDVARVSPRMGELGLYALLVPRALGGAASHPKERELDVRALCVVREALAYHSALADAVFAVQGLAAHALAVSGGERHRALLDELAAGKKTGAFALTEAEAGSDVASMKTAARRQGDGWVLDGDKRFISNAGIAHAYVVFANADPAAGKRGISAFLVDASARGLELEGTETTTDHPLGGLRFHACNATLLGDVGQGLKIALGTLDVFRTSVGAAAVGMAQRALDETLSHVTTRVQFGKPLSDFQLTQAALADMATDLEAARMLVYRAAWAKDHGASGPTDVAMAKLFATEAAQRIIDRAVQLHGGLGVTTSMVERLYREVRPLRIYEGTSEIQKLIIGSALVKEKTS